jgi:hypothetical protein
MFRLLLVVLALCSGYPGTSGTILLKHFPKAGGSFLADLGERIIPTDEFGVCHEFDRLADCIKKDPKSFVIGLIRDPCSLYLSLWAYGSEGNGEFRRVWHKDIERLRKREDQGDPPRLGTWVRRISPEQPGVYSMRFYQSYVSGFDDFSHLQLHNRRTQLDMFDRKIMDNINSSLALYSLVISRVDCWVDTMHLVPDFIRCIQMYNQNKSGKIDLSNVDHAVESASGRSNGSHHRDCPSYYDQQSYAHVARTESDIYRMFKFTPCGSWPRSACTDPDLQSRTNPCL